MSTIIDYLSGLTSFALDNTVLERIALDRGVSTTSPADLTERDKDLLLADILFTVYFGPSNIPSFAHQHGQFSMSVGQQTFGNKDGWYWMMIRLYSKWGDPKLDLIPESALSWSE